MAMVIGVALLLKRYYSLADSSDLHWILGPTTFVAQLLSGIDFVYEAGVGWINTTYNVAVVPECAGVNFLIICFCMSSFQVIVVARTRRHVFIGIAINLFAAWCATIMVNGVRIWLSIVLYQADIYSFGLTVAGVHRVLGIGVYYLFLSFYYRLVSFFLDQMFCYEKPYEDKKVGKSQFLLFVLPLFWYILFSLGVPLANNGYQLQPHRFVVHAQAVITVSVGITLLLLLVNKSCRQCTGKLFSRRPKKNGKTENSYCRG